MNQRYFKLIMLINTLKYITALALNCPNSLTQQNSVHIICIKYISIIFITFGQQIVPTFSKCRYDILVMALTELEITIGLVHVYIYVCILLATAVLWPTIILLYPSFKMFRLFWIITQKDFRNRMKNCSTKNEVPQQIKHWMKNYVC